jgi:hypothetical protein
VIGKSVTHTGWDTMRIKSGWSYAAKKSIDARFKPPVPQTDSGGQVENTKEIERIVVKELGKMPP